jgi:phosphoglycerate kinase
LYWRDAIAKSKELEKGEVLLLENLRFYKEEEKGNKDLPKNFQN